MLKKITLLFIELCLPLFLFCQDNFSKGILILSQNDTLSGYMRLIFIDDTSFLQFKSQEIATAVLSYADNVRAFQLSNGTYFETHEIIENNQKRLDFVQCLVKGVVSLYTYTDKNQKDRYFLSIRSGELRELQKEVQITKDEKTGKNYEYTKTLYYQLLAEAFLDCPTILSNLGSYDLNAKDLRRALEDYHACIKKDYQSFSKVNYEFKRPELGIYGGKNYLSIPNQLFANYDGTWGYQVGVYANFFVFKSRSRNSVQIGLEWAEHHYTLNSFAKQDYTIQQITMPILFKNYIRNGNWSPHLAVGLNPIIKKNEDSIFRRFAGIMVVGGVDYSIGDINIFFNVQGRFINQNLFLFNLGIAY